MIERVVIFADLVRALVTINDGQLLYAGGRLRGGSREAAGAAVASAKEIVLVRGGVEVMRIPVDAFRHERVWSRACVQVCDGVDLARVARMWYGDL
ncbi:hypothetical protein EPN28_02625 [Patescibacteria group bacterium]|nr:MAG: hypothetical protein EPN28_02625 [Patescibacteria group bacterium]